MVVFALDDDDRGKLSPVKEGNLLTELLGSNASSDNEQDELMEDVDDIEPEVDPDVDVDGDEDENDDDNGEDDQDGVEEEDDSPDQASLSQIRRPSLPTTNNSSDDTPSLGQANGGGPTSHPHPTLVRTSASPRQGSAPPKSPRMRLEVRPEALNASIYDIVPTMAAPQATSINAVTATPDFRYWFTGGSDCYIRKYDGVATVNGKTLLTVAQRHPFVDSVVKAGVLLSYWDNEEHGSKPGEEQALSPVYSLAVQSQALWVMSGLESGTINFYTTRHDEGQWITSLKGHKSAVSVLTLSQDEKSVLSGSWDKNVFDWDLNEGKIRRRFEGSGGQISAIEIRPASSLQVPEESGEPVQANGNFSSNNADKPLPNGTLTNGVNGHDADGEGNEDAPGSPADSLFGGGTDTNSLFGDTDGAGAPSGGHFGDDDDEFSRAIGAELENQGRDGQADISIGDADPMTVDQVNGTTSLEARPEQSLDENCIQKAPVLHTNGIIPEKGPESSSTATLAPETQDAIATSDSTFLAASIDGTLRVWDRRQPNPIARIPTRTGVPPWCMAACWSPDGNFIYAGRRNGTVEEFSLHKGLKNAERTFKFPQGSGAVSAVRAMPNGRHLIWYVEISAI
jgi:transcriptional activator SPT8